MNHNESINQNNRNKIKTNLVLQWSRPVFLKVGGIAPLEVILMGKGAKTPKG